ncbi:6-phospho-3-hexuloisomerase (plasmid) [Staphylococcus pseudoxylosus]|uniref:6-phospho-3-hexuloisomerase n=1 Tax=Staphylococcus pseudoxylosus TaxID=2282419 RepID=UPI0034D1FA7F
MTNIIEYMESINSEIQRGTKTIDDNELNDILEKIHHSERIFLSGAGRSSLVINAFANRLVHLGKSVYIVGDTVTPSIEKNDLLIIGSGSGETGSLVNFAQSSKNLGAYIIVNTTAANSSLGKLADRKIVIDVANKDKEGFSQQPMASLFEQLSLLLYDAIIMKYIDTYGVDHQTMRKKHSNLE